MCLRAVAAVVFARAFAFAADLGVGTRALRDAAIASQAALDAGGGGADEGEGEDWGGGAAEQAFAEDMATMARMEAYTTWAHRCIERSLRRREAEAVAAAAAGGAASGGGEGGSASDGSSGCGDGGGCSGVMEAGAHDAALAALFASALAMCTRDAPSPEGAGDDAAVDAAAAGYSLAFIAALRAFDLLDSSVHAVGDGGGGWSAAAPATVGTADATAAGAIAVAAAVAALDAVPAEFVDENIAAARFVIAGGGGGVGGGTHVVAAGDPIVARRVRLAQRRV